VIYNDSELIEGAVKSIKWLQKKEIPFRFLTNTTMKSRVTLRKKLASFGIHVQVDEIFSAVYAAAAYIKKSGKKKCHLLMMDDAKTEFSDFELNQKDHQN